MKTILQKPVISEKSMSKTADGRYVFEVDVDANKIEVKSAIKSAYKIDPIKVNIMNVRGKDKKFRGKYSGTTKKWRKAIVTVKKGQKIEGFEVK